MGLYRNLTLWLLNFDPVWLFHFVRLWLMDWWILFSSSNFIEKRTTNVPLLFIRLICVRDDIITIKVCNRANPSQVGFAHMYQHCFLLTHYFFFVTCLCHSTAKSWHVSSDHSNTCKFSKRLMLFWTAVKGNKRLHYSVASALQFSSFPHHHHFIIISSHSSKTGLIVQCMIHWYRMHSAKSLHFVAMIWQH